MEYVVAAEEKPSAADIEKLLNSNIEVFDDYHQEWIGEEVQDIVEWEGELPDSHYIKNINTVSPDNSSNS